MVEEHPEAELAMEVEQPPRHGEETTASPTPESRDAEAKAADEPFHRGGYLLRAVTDATELPTSIVDPVDRSVPRVRTQREVVQAGLVDKQLMVHGRGDALPPHDAKCFGVLRYHPRPPLAPRTILIRRACADGASGVWWPVHLRAWVAANPGEIMVDTWQEKEPMQLMLAAAGRSST
jgi:hypothetical protein